MGMELLHVETGDKITPFGGDDRVAVNVDPVYDIAELNIEPSITTNEILTERMVGSESPFRPKSRGGGLGWDTDPIPVARQWAAVGPEEEEFSVGQALGTRWFACITNDPTGVEWMHITLVLMDDFVGAGRREQDERGYGTMFPRHDDTPHSDVSG